MNPKELPELDLPTYETGFGYIYYLFDNEENIIYIGQTINLLSRIGKHFSEKNILFCKCKYRPIEIFDLNNVEADEILTYWPRCNRTIPTNSFFFNFNSYIRINPIIKGKRCKVKNLILKLNILDRHGYIEVSDWEKICDLLKGEKK